MTFVITQECCHDASCLTVCPVDCIHPTPAEPDFGRVDMLYVDARACIDCGACADACPVDAVTYAPRLRAEQRHYLELNAGYYEGRGEVTAPSAPSWPAPAVRTLSGLRVAVVGTGPSAAYLVEELLRLTDARVTVFDRSPLAGGLVRFGVAPDHPGTRGIGRHFARTFAHPRVTVRAGVEVGRDVAPAELTARFDAVVYAVGAGGDRLPDLPGWGTPGTLPVRALVGWYNGEPTAPAVDLSGVQRVVVIGTGNVALDAARVLASDPARLETTSISPAALAVLRSSDVREVVVLGRREAAYAAWSPGELTALRHLPGTDLVAEGGGVPDVPVADVDWSAPPPPGRRIVLAFGRPPVAVLGDRRVTGLRVGPDDTAVRTELVLAATGYRGQPVAGLPFDEATGTVPHERGRVTDRTYVVGWIKRGARGGIGANREDARETVDTLLTDLADAAAARETR